MENIKNKTIKVNIQTKLLGLYLITLFSGAYNPSTLFISEIIFLIFAVSVIKRMRIRISSWLLPIILIGLLSIISISWAYSQDIAIMRSKSILQMILLFLLVFQSIDSHKDLDYILHVYIVGVFIMYLVVFFTYGFDGLIGAFSSQFRLGLLVNEPNALGRYSVISLLISLSIYFKKKKLVYVFICIISLFMMLASGSRQAVLLFLIGGISYFIFEVRKNKFTMYLVVLLISLIFINILPMLSEQFPIFERYTRIIEAISGDHGVDGSFTHRSSLIAFGIELFKSKPILGHGVNQFIMYSGVITGVPTASHNGFIEVLINYGIFGFVIYYSVHAKIISSLYKKKNNSSYTIWLVIFIVLISSDVATIGLYDKFSYIMLGLGIALVNFNRTDRKVITNER